MTTKTKTHEENGDLREAIRLANAYAHCYSFVDDKTMSEAQTALFGHLAKVISQWQPIESAPRDNTGILCYQDVPDSEIYIIFVGYFKEGRWWQMDWSEDSEKFYEPTHWMPLPPPPTTEVSP